MDTEDRTFDRIYRIFWIYGILKWVFWGAGTGFWLADIYKVAVWLGDDVTTVQRHYGHLTPDDHGIEKAFSLRPHVAS